MTKKEAAKYLIENASTGQDVLNPLGKDEVVEFYRLMRGVLFHEVYRVGESQEEIENKLGKAETIFNGFKAIERHECRCFDCFLERLPRLKELLDGDVEAIYEGDPAANSKDEVVLAYPGFLAISAYRIAHELLGMGYSFIARIISEYAHSKTGIDIHPGADIGPHFFIDHGTGIVIGETTKIGKNVKIYQGVTLGALSLKEGRLLHGKKRHPTVEDGVTIYSGASIFGGETVIGEGSTIGSNAFITSSVPAHSLVRNKPFDLEIKHS